MKFILCLTTVGKLSQGEKIARHLVRKRLAACVNVLPGVVSFYHWKKNLCRDREALLVIKTTAAKVRSLEQELRKIHPYELPEFVILPIIGGSQKYLKWVKGSVVSPSR